MVEQIVRRGEPVALLVADQRMPGMSGVEFLAQALRMAPHAKRVLLTAYADTEAAIRAINEVRLDHYLMKPWSPPEERLYPVLDDLLEDWEADAAARSPSRACGSSATASRPRRTPRATSWPATASPTAGSTSPTPRRAACWPPPGGDEAELPVLVFEDGDDAGAALAGRAGGADRPAHPGGAALLRPGDPRRRAGRAGGGGLRRVGGPADPARGAPRDGRAGRPELAHRELPGLSRRASAAPTSRGARRRRRAAWAPRCSPPARSSASARTARRGWSRSTAARRSAPTACSSRRGSTTPGSTRPGVEALTGSGVYYGAAPAEAAAVEGEDVVVVGAANSAGPGRRSTSPPGRAG